jgi:hypothetical protein
MTNAISQATADALYAQCVEGMSRSQAIEAVRVAMEATGSLWPTAEEAYRNEEQYGREMTIRQIAHNVIYDMVFCNRAGGPTK